MTGLATDRAAAALSAIWVRRRGEILTSVGVVEGAVIDALAGQLDDAGRARACRDAHKLAGSTGTFGFLAAGEMARELERALAGPSLPSLDQLPHLADVAVALRRELEVDSASPAAATSSPRTADLLVVGGDRERVRRLADEAAARGLVASVAATPAEGRLIVERLPPRIVLLDPVGNLDGALSFLAAVSPLLPVLVLADAAGDLDGVEIARRGGRGFLPRSLTVSELVDHVVGLRDRLRTQEATILAVDDDPAVLDAVRAVLELDGLTVQTSTDPSRLWEQLERFTPDLLMLDIEMPGASGLDLCRAVRNDPRWSALPVLILTARTEPGTVESVFEAGADDYIAKPVGGRELTARINNRLERVRLLRALADRTRKLEDEVRTAAGVQRGLLPTEPVLVDGAVLGGLSAPAAEVGGDYYDFMVRPSGEIVLVIADVAGHSISSALLMAMARTVLREQVRRDLEPHDLLEATNATMYDDLVNAGLFITMFCASYDPATRYLTFANGGHNPPLLRRAAGRVEELDADGAPAGLLAHVGFEIGSVQLHPGDLVVLYTDGVVEAGVEDDVPFGQERLIELVAACDQQLPDEVGRLIHAAVVDHAGFESARRDDITVAGLRVVARPAEIEPAIDLVAAPVAGSMVAR